MKSRILSVILIILVAFSFASCGGKEKEAGPSGNRQESSLEDKSGDNKETKTANNGTDESAKAGDIDESELPEAFRIDLVPIFKGSVIVDVEEDTDHSFNMVTCYSDKPFAAVEAFYKQIMSNYQVRDEQENTGSYYVEGSISDLDAIMIQVVDVSKEDDPEKPKNANTGFQLAFQRLKNKALPAWYRSDLVPVMGKSELKEDRVLDDKDGKKVYSLTFETKYEYEEVVEFYRGMMMFSDTTTESESPSDCIIESIIYDVEITISISKLPSGSEYKTACTVQMAM